MALCERFFVLQTIAQPTTMLFHFALENVPKKLQFFTSSLWCFVARVPNIILSMALHRSRSQMPSRSFYCSLEPPADFAASLEEETFKGVSVASASTSKMPTITITPPSPQHEAPQPILKALDPSRLHSRYVTSLKSPAPLGPIKKKRKREIGDDHHDLRHAPSPSLFSYDLCRSDCCPINLVYEKGTFLHLGKESRINDQSARELVEKLFGNSTLLGLYGRM